MKRRKRNLKYKSTDVIDIDKAREERRKKREAAGRKSRRKKKTEDSSEIMAVEPKKNKKKRRIEPRRVFIYAVILIVLAGVVGWKAYNIGTLNAELKAVQQEKKELKAQKEELQQELKTVDDPAYVEQKARENLHMIKPGETLYILQNQQEEGATEKADPEKTMPEKIDTTKKTQAQTQKEMQEGLQKKENIFDFQEKAEHENGSRME